MVTTDVLIVGGGPAGLAAAIAVREKGLAVTVVDAAKPPIDKACGEGLLPGGVETLKKLGVRLAARHFAPLRAIRFIDGGTSARAEFPGVCGLGMRRTTLHSLLVERAEELGVTLRWNTTVPGRARVGRTPSSARGPLAVLLRSPSTPGPDNIHSRWIIGADGLNSQVRRWAGFGECPARVRRFGFRRHFPVTPWSDTVDVHWGRDCQVYVTPLGQDEVCVAVISRHPQLRLDLALQSFPELSERLGAFLPSTPERGSVTECRQLSKVYRGNVALIGDASGSVDAVTGEGLALSFSQALALADAIAADDLRLYDAAHRRIARTPTRMANLILLMDQRAWLRHGVIRTLASESGLFSKLLAMHIGAMSPLEAGLPWIQSSKTA